MTARHGNVPLRLRRQPVRFAAIIDRTASVNDHRLKAMASYDGSSR
jgi:hypothetical protein